MSDAPPSHVPMMEPEKARDLARGYKWLADRYEDAGMRGDATAMLRNSNWWLAYAIALANTKPETTT